MEQLKRYRIPALTGVGTLIVVLIVYMAWVSPQGSHLSSLRAQETQLQSQQQHLQVELTTLRGEKAHLAANCQALTTDLTEIPGTPTVDAFFHQVTALAVAAGDPNTPSISVTQAPGGSSGTDEVTVALSLAGTYGQMSSFIKGLTSFPRLFTVTDLTINGGPVVTGGAGVNPSAAGYTLNLSGDIYYSAGQTNVCEATTTADG
ncbi:MAG TPA: type 4a pilus biogenesis protein PilO [Acidimicrobiales bacterium]|nr:type 4a pilus biogenesis protein PilO [Acidimicrobiales bacterium]